MVLTDPAFAGMGMIKGWIQGCMGCLGQQGMLQQKGSSRQNGVKAELPERVRLEGHQRPQHGPAAAAEAAALTQEERQEGVERLTPPVTPPPSPPAAQAPRDSGRVDSAVTVVAFETLTLLGRTATPGPYTTVRPSRRGGRPPPV